MENLPNRDDIVEERTVLLQSQDKEICLNKPNGSEVSNQNFQNINEEFHRGTDRHSDDTPHISHSNSQHHATSHSDLEEYEIRGDETANCRQRIPTWKEFTELWMEWSSQVIDSVYFIPILVLLLALPIWIGFFGCRYLLSCPMDAFIPTAFGFMGLFGSAGIMSRIVFIFYKKYWDQENTLDDWDGQRKCIYYGNFIFFVFFIIEWTLYLCKTPSFRPKDANFCHPDFHGMTCYINWSVFCFILVWGALHGPTLLRILKEFCEHEARLSERRRLIAPSGDDTIPIIHIDQ